MHINNHINTISMSLSRKNIFFWINNSQWYYFVGFRLRQLWKRTHMPSTWSQCSSNTYRYRTLSMWEVRRYKINVDLWMRTKSNTDQNPLVIFWLLCAPWAFIENLTWRRVDMGHCPLFLGSSLLSVIYNCQQGPGSLIIWCWG